MIFNKDLKEELLEIKETVYLTEMMLEQIYRDMGQVGDHLHKKPAQACATPCATSNNVVEHYNVAKRIKDDKERIVEDLITSPSHYKLDGLGSIESIDVVKSVLGEEGFKSFCIGNVLKYTIRHKKKNGNQDLRKARVYLNWAIGD